MGFDNGSLKSSLMRAVGFAGIGGRRVRLHNIVDDAIKRHGNTRAAHRMVSDAIDNDPALMLALIDSLSFRDGLIRHFQTKRAEVLSTTGTVIPFEGRGVGQDAVGSRCGVTHTTNNTAEGGRRAGLKRRESQRNRTRTTEDASREDAGVGQAMCENQASDNHAKKHQNGAGQSARTTKTSGGGQHIAENHSNDTPASRPDGQTRSRISNPRAQAKRAERMNKCLLDTIQINGRALREATPGEALQQAERWHIRACMVKAICQGLVDDKPVGEQIDDADADARAKNVEPNMAF